MPDIISGHPAVLHQIRPGRCRPNLGADQRRGAGVGRNQLAAEKGIEYFDFRPLSQGHDMCAAPADRYFEGFRVVHPAAPLHPNALGAAAVGNALADHIG